MLRRLVVALLEARAIVASDVPRNMWVTKLVAVIYVPDAMIRVVPFGTLNSVDKALPLNLPQFARRRIPATLTIRNRWPRRRSLLITRGWSRRRSILRERCAHT
jgi:hypothetical protein